MHSHPAHPPLSRADVIFALSISQLNIQILAERAKLLTLLYN